MHLTRYTDYAMRVLLYLGRQPENLCSIAEISGAYVISQNHLMKVVSDLVSAGYLESVRAVSYTHLYAAMRVAGSLCPSLSTRDTGDGV